MPNRKDDYAFFLAPVNLEKVPGYMDLIKQPMDFGTMADKVYKSKYRSLDEFAVRSILFPFPCDLNSRGILGRLPPRHIQCENIQSPRDYISQ
jgi:hypothetical protein